MERSCLFAPFFLRGLVAVDEFAEGAEWGEGEDGFNGQVEERGELQGEGKGRVVVAAFEESDGLVVDVEGLGELLTGEPALGAKDGDTVMQSWICVAHSFLSLRRRNILSTICLGEVLLPVAGFGDLADDLIAFAEKVAHVTGQYEAIGDAAENGDRGGEAEDVAHGGGAAWQGAEEVVVLHEAKAPRSMVS